MITNKIELLREVLSLRNYAPQTINTYLKTIAHYNDVSGLQKPSKKSWSYRYQNNLALYADKQISVK